MFARYTYAITSNTPGFTSNNDVFLQTHNNVSGTECAYVLEIFDI